MSRALLLAGLLAVSGATQAQNLTPTALLGLDGLLDKAEETVSRLEQTGGEWTRQWTSAINAHALAVRDASTRVQQGISTAAAELRVAQAQLAQLLDRAERAFTVQRICTRQDLRYLLATTDAAANSLAAANFPWSQGPHFVAAGHAQGNPMHVGVRLGQPAVFELEGSYPGLSLDCGKPTARLVPVILDSRSSGDEKPIDLSVISADARNIRVRIPPVRQSGTYNLQVAYARDAGLLKGCDDNWTYATWVLPVAAKNDEWATIEYNLTPSCYRPERSTATFSRELRSENGEVKEDGTTLAEGCRFTSVRTEHIVGDQMATYVLLDGNRRVVFTERSQERECRTRALGQCVDWLNHFGQHRFHADWSCDSVKEVQDATVSGAFKLVSGGSGSEEVKLSDVMKSARDGQMCRWSLSAKFSWFRNGELIRTETREHAQPPPAQHPTSGESGAEWFKSGRPTSEVASSINLQGDGWSLYWNADRRSMTASVKLSPLTTCGLYE